MNAAQNIPQDTLLSICKASADALRLDVLRVLSLESFGVMELCHIFEIAQPAMSHHLKILATAGLLATRREGNSIFYRRALIPSDSPMASLLATLFDAVDQVDLDASILHRIAEVHTERDISSRQFFERNANRLKENQDLIAEFEHYAGSVTDLIRNEHLSPELTVLEIGPGESVLLATLANQFHQVLALDSSEEMLAKAKLALPADISNVTFIHGDLATATEVEHVDLMVLNMVLHHMASPRQLFATAHTKLNPGGSLFIMDLCPHNQDWSRDVCGDLWLGFEPIDLDAWATEAGLQKGQAAYLGLKNGFQVQLRLFHKPSHKPNQ